jgi:predicted ArsR family transcriptional regulator
MGSKSKKKDKKKKEKKAEKKKLRKLAPAENDSWKKARRAVAACVELAELGAGEKIFHRNARSYLKHKDRYRAAFSAVLQTTPDTLDNKETRRFLFDAAYQIGQKAAEVAGGDEIQAADVKAATIWAQENLCPPDRAAGDECDDKDGGKKSKVPPMHIDGRYCDFAP